MVGGAVLSGCSTRQLQRSLGCGRGDGCAPRGQRGATPGVERDGIGRSGEIGEIANRYRELAHPLGGPPDVRRGGGVAAPRREDGTSGLIETIDAIERVPRCIDGTRVCVRVLQSEGGKGLPMAAAPRLAARMIQRKQDIEALGARIIGSWVLRAAFRTLRHSDTDR